MLFMPDKKYVHRVISPLRVMLNQHLIRIFSLAFLGPKYVDFTLLFFQKNFGLSREKNAIYSH